MTEEEKKLFQLYGKLPAKKSNPLARMQVRLESHHRRHYGTYIPLGC